MGHCINYFTFDKDTTRAQILNEFEEYAWEERSDGGYGSTFTMHKDIVCDSYDDAIEKIDSLDKGWYDDHAVLFRDTRALKPTAAIKRLEERVKKMRADKDAYIKEHTVENRKSAYVGCPECGSKLSVAHLHGRNQCPLCHTDLRSKTVKDRIAKYDADMKDLNKRIEAEYKKMKNKAPLKWCAKCEFHV